MFKRFTDWVTRYFVEIVLVGFLIWAAWITFDVYGFPNVTVVDLPGKPSMMSNSPIPLLTSGVLLPTSRADTLIELRHSCSGLLQITKYTGGKQGTAIYENLGLMERRTRLVISGNTYDIDWINRQFNSDGEPIDLKEYCNRSTR